MRSPSAYEKLTQEIDNASASGQLSYPLIRYNEAIKLPYLDACCKEGMRLHPSVALTVPRNVPAGGCQISGEFFPAGTRVGINAAVIHRDQNIFGHDADDFVPERWLRADTTIMDRHMFQFGGGARTCVGKNVRIWPHSQVLPLILLRRSPFVKCTKSYHKSSVLTISHSSMARTIGRHIIIGSTKRVV
jgi:cytochrome P450